MPFWRSGRDRGVDGDADRNAPDPRTAPTDPERSRLERPAEQPASLEVEGAMRRVAEQDTPENRTALFELLLRATLLAATPDSNSEGAERGLAMIAGEDGPALPVFTRIEAMLAWRPTGYGPVALTGRTLFETAARYKTAKIEVNPASVPRGWISRAEIESLAEGRVPLGPTEQPPARQSESKVAPPSFRPPDALIEAVRRALDAQADAVAGWLFASVPEGGPAQLTIGVELTRGLERASIEATMQAIVEETWARSADADRLRFMLVADPAFRETLASGAGELIFER